MKNLGNFYFYGDRESKTIALTFDDGPSTETEKILDLLKKYNAKATFFVWGQRIKGREKIIRKIIKEGHEFGNHTFSHKRLYFKSKRFIDEDIKRCDKELKKVGIKTNLFRLPGSKFGINSIIVCNYLNKKVIFCDIISNDWLGPWLKVKFRKTRKNHLNKVINKVLRKTKNGSIISFHDYLEGVGSHPEIIPILGRIVPELKKKGYEFITVSELLKFKTS